MGDFSKVRPGQPLSITAKAWNRVLDTVSTNANFDTVPNPVNRTNFVAIIKNTTIATVPRWGVLKIDGVLNDPSLSASAKAQWEDTPVYLGKESLESDGGRFAIALEPIKAGQCGRAAIAGVVQCRLEIDSEDDWFASPTGIHMLKTGTKGAVEILWKEGGTGSYKWGIVRLSGGSGSAGIVLSKTTQQWDQDTSQTLTVYKGDGGSEVPDVGNTVVAWNKWTDIGADEWVMLGQANGTWYVIERPNYGGRLVRGTYSGAWPSGGAMKVVTETLTGDTYQVKNWLTPISGDGGNCVFGPAFGEYVLVNFSLTDLADYGGTCILGSEGGVLKWFPTVICT